MGVSEEDYLRTIYAIYEKDITKEIKSADIAKAMQVSRPSVYGMVRKLAKKGNISISNTSKITLTKAGLLKARKLMHKHRVIEVFLTDVLGRDLNEVHAEAHNLEHAFSDKSVEQIDKLLNNPQISPSGKKIPHGQDGVQVRIMTLDKVPIGMYGRIIRVSGFGNLHKRILEMGVVKGAKVTVVKTAPLGDPLEIKVKNYSLSLRKEEAKNIEVALE